MLVSAVGGKEYTGHFGAVLAEAGRVRRCLVAEEHGLVEGPDMTIQLKNDAAVAGSSTRSQPYAANRLKRAAIEIMARLGPLSHSTCPSSGNRATSPMTSRRNCRMRGVSTAFSWRSAYFSRKVGSSSAAAGSGTSSCTSFPARVVIVETSSMNSASLLPKCL